MAKAEWKRPGFPKPPTPVLPNITRYDHDPVLRTAYFDYFRQGYRDAWERKEKLPVFSPTNDVDKARVLGYAEGEQAGRIALSSWFGTNGQQIAATNRVSSKP